MACAASLESDPEKVGLELGDSDSDKECSICHELFTNPKLLPCAHVMCRHCILTWLSTNQEPVCPLCRCAIADTVQGKQPQGGWEKVVEELPDDVAMAALVECTRLLRIEHVCGGCQQSSAVSVCLHCGDMLCDTCTTAHGNLTATRLHKVESLSTMTAEKLCTSKPATCSEHADRASELYCPKHCAAICQLCACSFHRACPEVIFFDKRVQELKDELAAMSKMLKTAEQNLTRSIDDLDNKLLAAERKTNLALAEVEEACNRLENSVNACRKRLKELALQSKKRVEESVLETKAGLLKHRGRMTSHRRLVDRVKLTSPPGKLERVTELVRQRAMDMNLSNTTNATIAVQMASVRVNLGVAERLDKELQLLGLISFELLSGTPAIWRFAKAYAKNIVFSNDDLTVEKVSGNNSILVATTPMEIDVLYEIRINDVRGKSEDFFIGGVVRKHPCLITVWPTAGTYHGWGEAIVFCNMVYQYGKVMPTTIGSALRFLHQGQTIGFVLDTSGKLCLYVDGTPRLVFATEGTQLYIFFELHHTYRKITCLPPKNVTNPQRTKAQSVSVSVMNMFQ